MKKTLTSLALVGCLSTLAACSGDAEEPAPKPAPSANAGSYAEQGVDKIAEDVREAMGDVTSAHVTGLLKQPSGDTLLDATMTEAGDCEGNIKLPVGEADFIAVKEAFYVKGDTEFWTTALGDEERAKAVVKTLGDKWAQAPETGEVLTSFCDLQSLTSVFTNLSSENVSSMEMKGAAMVDGEPAVQISDGMGTLTVAAEAPHYVLSIEPGDGSSLLFSDFNETATIEAPPAADVQQVK